MPTVTKIFRPHILVVDDGYSPQGAATEVAACDPGDPVAHDDDTSYATIGSGSLNAELGFRTDPAFQEKMASVETVTIRARARRINSNTDNYQLKVSLQSSTNTSSAIGITTSYANGSYDISSLRPGGGLWSEDDFRDPTLQFIFRGSNPAPEYRITSLWMDVVYVPSAIQVAVVRSINTRRLKRRRSRLKIVTMDVGPEFLDLELGKLMNVSHFAIPVAGGGGAGVQPWQRKLYYTLGVSFNRETMRNRLTLVEADPILMKLFDGGGSNISASSQRDGIPQFALGATRTFLRNSAAWVEDPGSRFIVEVPTNVEKIDFLGHLIETGVANAALNSSFVDGVAAQWSLIGSATRAADTADLLFDSAVTAQSCKLTAPASAGDNGMNEPTATVNASTPLRFSLDWKSDTGHNLEWLIQRADDSRFWDDTNATWNVADTRNTFTGAGGKQRSISKLITAHTANSTYTIGVRVRQANQVAHLYHSQLEETRWASSRIVTTGSVGLSREDDEFTYSNNRAGRVMPFNAKAIGGQVIPHWATADLASGAKKTIYYNTVDANNYEHLFYEQSTASWVFERAVGGTLYKATKAETVSRGTVYQVTARSVSGAGELGEDPHTLSIWVNATKGTDVTAVQFPDADATLEIGRAAANTHMLDGTLQFRICVQKALTDVVMERYPSW